MSAQLEPDRDQIERFVNALFMHAGEGGTVSLRVFFDDELAKKRKERAYKIRPVKLNGDGREPVIDLAARLAQEAGELTRATVVCPPVATFQSGKAEEKNVLEGLVILVEMDQRPAAGVANLREIIGRPTIVVASGGLWLNPETGELEPKQHAYWRLAEPTQTSEEHARLKRARELACKSVDGDASAVALAHPIRWAGTWHRKNLAEPRRAEIIEYNPDAEIILEDALAELEGLETLRDSYEHQPDDGKAYTTTADDDLLLACAERIPNPDLDWHAWNRIGMAFYRASGGSDVGFKAFDVFSRKSTKCVAGGSNERWESYTASPPDRLTAGTLIYEARKADPDFLKRKPKPEADEGAEGQAASEQPGDDWEAKLASAIEELNGRHFTLWMAGRALIGGRIYDTALDRERLVFSKKEDIKLRYNNRHCIVGHTLKGNPVWKDLGTAWIEDPRRRSYNGVTLDPKGQAPANIYNLWLGWGVEPKAGDWPLLRQHMQEVICSGNEEHYRYLIGWCAHCAQHPEKQAEVAVVMRGLKGTGKGTLAQVMMRIFRHHSLHITHSRHLVGNFNAHLIDALFLFLDEAFWGGDKQGEGVLKALVTEPTVQIEPKGVDSFPAANRLKIMMASNNDWVVPATADERRFFMPSVSDARKGDRAYFNALYKAIEGGETAAFLHYLLSYGLSEFSIRDVPHTEELNKQKVIGADSVTRFWEDCLREGAIIGHVDANWPEEISTQALHLCYTEHARTHGERHPAIDARMGERLEDLCKGCGFKRARLPPMADGKRAWGRKLDNLETHRKAFERALNMVDGYNWPEDDQ